ncbi:RNA polymerase sigma factor [Kineococcus sp. SYSU DK005]|uniref:RNA polymerase sigma factor n=1 Tax=Kineococcus sp. SYSU DK005 TaxID=3383126 RepID=UPI003D7E2A09
MEDAQAFAALFARQHHLIHAFAARRVGAGDAEEVTSEVFLRAWQHWPRSGQRAPGWLYRTAANVIAEQLRTRKRQDHLVQHLQHLAARAGRCGQEQGWEQGHERGQDAEARLEQADAAAALLQLSAADREILLALSWDGLSTSELAVLLGCSVAAAHVRVHRARRRLAALTGSAGSAAGTSTSTVAGKGPAVVQPAAPPAAPPADPTPHRAARAAVTCDAQEELR